MIKVLKVTSNLTPNNTHANLTDEAVNIINQYNNSNCQLFLNVFTSYQNNTLCDILDEGMYDYEVKGSDKNLCNNIVNMLNELTNYAHPYYFGESDVVIL
jgi:hypothetical protein